MLIPFGSSGDGDRERERRGLHSVVGGAIGHCLLSKEEFTLPLQISVILEAATPAHETARLMLDQFPRRKKEEAHMINVSCLSSPITFLITLLPPALDPSAVVHGVSPLRPFHCLPNRWTHRVWGKPLDALFVPDHHYSFAASSPSHNVTLFVPCLSGSRRFIK